MVLVLIGTSGSGKTTVGEELARRLGWRFVDADDYHPPANVRKIREGTPLTDADRAPWLRSLRSAIEVWQDNSRPVVLACSALKRSYRDELRAAPDLRFVYLKAAYDVVEERVEDRKGHFAGQDILPSQFEALEEPSPDEGILTVDANLPVEDVVAQIEAGLDPG